MHDGRVLESKVESRFSYSKALEIILQTNSALIANKPNTFLISPLHSDEFKETQQSLTS